MVAAKGPEASFARTVADQGVVPGGLRANGRGQEADRARDRSLTAYEEAMKIQAGVIGSAVPAAPAPPSRP